MLLILINWFYRHFKGCEMADIINSLRLEDVLNVNYRRTDGQPSKGDLDEKYELICNWSKIYTLLLDTKNANML